MERKEQMTKRLSTAQDFWEMGEEAEWHELGVRILTTASTLSDEDVISGFACRVVDLSA
jgi:hypothetical protein